MTDTDQEKKEDEVLKRMLRTPHKPHKDGVDKKSRRDSKNPSGSRTNRVG